MTTFEYDILFFQVKKQKDYDAMRSALNERGAARRGGKSLQRKPVTTATPRS